MTHLDEILTIKGQEVYTRDNCQLGKWLNDTNVEGSSDAWYISDYIALKPNTKYHIKFNMRSSSTARRFFFYTADKSHYRLVKKQSSEWKVGIIEFDVTTNNDEVWMRWSSLQTDTDESAIPDTDFKSIGEVWQRAVPTDSTKGASTVINNSRKAINLFDISKAEEKWVGTSGAFTRSGGCTGIQFEVEQGATYYFTTEWTNIEGTSKFTCLAEYDENKTYISGTRKNITTPTNDIEQNSVTITNPNTKYVAFSTYIISPNWWMIRKDDASTTYYPYFSAEKVMPNLKTYGGQVQEVQPDLWGRYTPVEYLQSSGTQYIDTGLIGDSKDKVEIKYQPLDTNGNQAIFGARSQPTTAYKKTYIIWQGISGVIHSDYGDETSQRLQFGQTALADTIFIKDGEKNTLNGVAQSSHNAETYNLEFSYYIFGANTKGTFTVASQSKVYYCKIWSNGSLARNFIPVKDTTNNIYGMYDTVEGKFYGNSGTGTFTAGPEIKRVEYVEMSDAQYLNTDIKPTVNTKAEFKFTALTDSVSNLRLIGSNFPGLLVSGSNTTIFVNSANYSTIPTNSIVDGNIHTMDIHSNVCILDGVSYTVDSVVASDSYIYINTLGISPFQRMGHTRWYNCKITDNGTVKRDFIPVKLGTEYAMFDTVEWKVYHNAGTGSFTGGSEIPDRLLNPYTLKGNLGNIRYGYEDGAIIPSEYDRVEYITNSESTGASASYIDTGLILGSDADIEITFQSNYYTTTSPWVFGSRKTVTKGYALDIQSNLVVASYGGNNTINDIALKDQLKHTVTVNSGIWKADGVQFLNKSDMIFTGDGNFLLFGMTHTDDAIETRAFAGNIFGFKAWRSGALIANFVPVKKVSNNEYGMYDTVSKIFFGNAGTSSFTGGSVISRKVITDGSHTVLWPCKNLAPWWTWETGTISTSTGEEVDNVNRIRSAFIPVEQIKYKASLGLRVRNGILYDKDKHFIKNNVYPNPTTGVLDLTEQPNNMKYIRVIYSFQEEAPITPLDVKASQFQLEIGETSTEYEDNKVEITDLLYSANDYVDIQAGKRYNAWGIYVFDGSESFTYQLANYWRTTDIESTSAFGKVYCTHLTSVDSWPSTENRDNTVCSYSGYVQLGLHTLFSDVSNFKSWLKEQYNSGNPLIIIYPLKTPTETTTTTTPISLTTKGSKTITSAAEVPVSIQAKVLQK